MVPRENKNNAYAKFEGTNKEYCGIFRCDLSNSPYSMGALKIFTCAYLFQIALEIMWLIALEIMWLPILILWLIDFVTKIPEEKC